MIVAPGTHFALVVGLMDGAPETLDRDRVKQ
jgi:hypothetical protein